MVIQNETQSMYLTPKEINLVNTLREIPYGNINIVSHNAEPVYIEKGIETRKFSDIISLLNFISEIKRGELTIIINENIITVKYGMERKQL